MSLQRHRGVIKAILISSLALAPFAALFLFPIVVNNMRGFRLSTQLAAVELPSGARIIERTSRVFNSGNGDACDYQAILIVSYYGEAASLRDSFFDFTQAYAEQFPDARVRSDQSRNGFMWVTSFRHNSTELIIQPNIDSAGLYLIVLTHYAREINFDLRCL